MAGYDLMDQREGYRRTHTDAQQAIALDPSLAAGYLALGWVQMKQDWDWKSTEASLNKAAELEPGSVDVLRYRADLYRTLGRLDEAIDLQKQVVALDPLRARSYATLGNMLFEMQRYEEAQASLQKLLELNPEQEPDHFRRGQLLLAEGQVQKALAEMEQEPREDWRWFGEALAYHAAGRPQESDTNLKRLITIRPSGWAYQIAEVYAYRGEIDKAFDWMDRAYQQRDRGLLVVKSDWPINSPLSVVPTLSTTAHARKTASVVFPVRTFQSTLIATDAFNFFFWRRNPLLEPCSVSRRCTHRSS
jgi:tetratricopeptide (TPR) repeat protein